MTQSQQACWSVWGAARRSGRVSWCFLDIFGFGREDGWVTAHTVSLSWLIDSPLLSPASSATEPGPSEGLDLRFSHLNPIIITLMIDNIPPFQRAVKSVSTKDDIIVVPERRIQTITHSSRSGKVCPSIGGLCDVALARAWAPHQPQKPSARKQMGRNRFCS